MGHFIAGKQSLVCKWFLFNITLKCFVNNYTELWLKGNVTPYESNKLQKRFYPVQMTPSNWGQINAIWNLSTVTDLLVILSV